METTLWIIIAVLILALLGMSRKHLLPKSSRKMKGSQDAPPVAACKNEFPLSQQTGKPPSGDNVHLQLEIIRQSLQLTTAILLWADEDEAQMQILSVTSLRDDIAHTPFPRGSGIIGGIRPDCPELAVSPVSSTLPIPYYTTKQGVGSLLAMTIPLQCMPSSLESDLPPTAMLVMDRARETPWTENEREVARLTCRKLSHDLRLDCKMEETARDSQAIQQICRSLQEFNQVLELDAVFAATMNTVKKLTHADFAAISLLENDTHHIVKAEGPKSDSFTGLSFPAEDGMVGQAIKLKRWLPAQSNLQEDAPIFSSSMKIAGLKSLLILPLLREDNEAIGALTVAGRKADMFAREKRELLQVIAGQVATKIELGRAHDKIFQMATRDGLTGLSNHRTFQHAFDNMLHRARRQSSPLAMVICDLDHFKRVNDTYGHPFGDKVLQEVARVLSATIRTVDLAARYGGEEFALLLENSNSNGASVQVERVRRAIADLVFHHSGESVTISMSFGLASFPKDADNKNDLIAQADMALYEAKRQGRNCTVVWSDKLNS